MSRNPKLTDLQLILLSTATQRKDGNVFPLADSIAREDDRIAQAIAPLLRRNFIEEAPVKQRTRAWREEDQQLVGLVITSAGRAIIGADEGEDETALDQKQSAAELSSEVHSKMGVGSKVGLVLGLLRRAEGATISDLTGATGWLPHTTRAALTGLRKKGYVIAKAKRDDVTCYRIDETA